MKVSPVSSGANTVGAISGDSAPTLRSIKMAVNATPGQITSPGQIESLPGLPIKPEDPEAQAPVEATQALSPQIAALRKAERALQVKERELAEREKALSGQPSTQDGVYGRDRVKSDPLGVLLESGVTYEQLTDAILNQQSGTNPKISELESKLKALEEGVEKKFVDRETQAEKQVLAEMRREATQLVSQGEDYELVRETGSIPHVMRLIEATYRKEGRVMDVTEALKEVEDYLFDESMKIARLNKVQSKLLPPAPPPQQRQARTLTNRDTANSPLSPKARALAAFHGTLKG